MKTLSRKYLTPFDYRLMNILAGIKSRCENPNVNNYHRYGGRGITNHLTREDLKLLWERDHADTMVKPSIDRIDNNGNYTLSNCQFIELRENVKKDQLRIPNHLSVENWPIDDMEEWDRLHKERNEWLRQRGRNYNRRRL